ncbi:ATP-grasp domain-containing protein [Cytobacillus firmus]|uniref:ATP-grasp domain-containing protein n=1 Tax=Cytobacillus firmus TaxID=1399 RepID=UPI0018CF84BD|nr:ATP-grasp domain-containing protein [Cytobacillus firmus]MBG9548458.1 hypothetical protein [Cytobacillus firmus]MBG9602133.1 hypothetical protein [Cytobacillus firmus]MED1943282.1 ATP-grasp domain-containing protein [Cytobacillus firmus]
MKHILVLGGSVSLLEYLKDQNLKYTVVLSIKEEYNSCYLSDAEEVFILNYENYDSVLKTIKFLIENYRIEGILCLSEKDIPIAAKIAKELDFYFVTESAARISLDKQLMREKLNNNPNLKVEYGIVRSFKDIETFIIDSNKQYILKPINLTGSKKVNKIVSTQCLEFLKSSESIEETDFPLIIEEFLDGTEYSIETFSVKGRHKVIGITKKIKNTSTFIEYGHSFPDYSINNEVKQKIYDFTIEVLNNIGLLDGPSHTEIMYTCKGPKLIETHTRFGGDNIPELIKLSTGIDLPSSYINLFINNKMPEFMDSEIYYNNVAAIRYFELDEGYLEEINGIEEVQKMKNVYDIKIEISPNSYISKDNDSFDRKGYVIMVGDSIEHIENTWSKVLNIVDFKIGKKETFL